MRTSYRILFLLTFFIAGSAFAGHFSASELPAGVGLKKKGRIVIRNDAQSITAYRFFGNVSEALVSLRTSKILRYSAFGDAVYDSSASVNAPFADVIADAARAH